MSYPDPVSNHISSISVITHDYRTFPGIKIKLAYFIPSITTNPLIYLNRCTYKSMVYRIRRIRSILVRAGPPGEYLVGSSLRKGEDPSKLTPLTGGTINIILFIVSCSRLGLYPVPNRLTRRRPWIWISDVVLLMVGIVGVRMSAVWRIPGWAVGVWESLYCAVTYTLNLIVSWISCHLIDWIIVVRWVSSMILKIIWHNRTCSILKNRPPVWVGLTCSHIPNTDRNPRRGIIQYPGIINVEKIINSKTRLFRLSRKNRS